MAHIEDNIKARLFRISCPDSTELGEYQLKLLPDEQMDTIKTHLAHCPHCTRELTQLQAFLLETAVDLEVSLTERIKIWIARLIPDSPTATGSPAFTVRGDDIGPLMYEAGDAQLSLEIQDDPEKAGRKTILGLVLGIDPEGFEAQLWQAGEQGTIAGLPSGAYELILTGPDVEIHVQELLI